LLFLGLGTCTVMTGVLQSKGLAKFTATAPLQFEPLQPSPAAIAQAQGSLEQSRRAAEDGTAAEVGLTVEDLNTLIATTKVLESYRTTARVRAITPQALDVEMSQELRGKRFLNGLFRFTPARSETNTWQLMLEDVDVPDRVVPGPFIPDLPQPPHVPVRRRYPRSCRPPSNGSTGCAWKRDASSSPFPRKRRNRESQRPRRSGGLAPRGDHRGIVAGAGG